MQFVSGDSNHTAQMKALIEQRHGLALRAFVGFFLSNQRLNLLSQQTTDGSSTTGGENSDLLERLPG
jgi:hypothetical protein